MAIQTSANNQVTVLSASWNSAATAYTAFKLDVNNILTPATSILFDVGTNTGTYSSKFNIDVSGSTTTTGYMLLGTSRQLQIYPDYGGSGELLAGGYISSVGNNSIFMIPSSNGFTGAAATAGIGYYNGTAWYSALQVSNVASGFSNLLFMRSGGNVGIGITNPVRTFEVHNNTNYQIRIGNSPAGTQYTYDIGRNTSNGFLYFYGNQNNANGYLFDGINGSRMLIDQNGDVGIGTSTYTARLFVSGSSTASTPTMIVREGVVSPTGGAGTFDVQNSAGTSVLFVSGSGVVGIGTTTTLDATFKVARGTAVNGTAMFMGTTAHSHFNYSTSEDTYIRGGKTTSRVFVNDTYSGDVVIAAGGGNVGVGTATYTARLFVSGTSTASTPTMIVREGVVSPTGGALAFEVENSAGTTILAVSGSGNVGIGSSSPGAVLDVNAGVNGRFRFAAGGTSAISDIDNFTFRSSNTFTTFMTLNGTGLGIGASPSSRLFVSGGINASTPTMVVREGYASPLGGVGVFDVQNSAGTSILFVSGSGNVGIGTNNPAAFSGFTALTVHNATNGGLIQMTTGARTLRAQVNLSGPSLFGTTTTTDLAFMSNAVERIRVDSTGNVGIGTGTYTARLFISGSSTATTPTAIIREGVVSPTGGAGVLDVQNSAGTSLFFVTGSQRVGIGTLTPGAGLHVVSSLNVGAIFSSTNSTQFYLQFSYNTGTTFGYLGNGTGLVTGGGNTDVALRSETGGSILFAAGGSTERVRIDTSGNVGIGTATVGSLLHLNAAAGSTIMRFSDSTNGTFGFLGPGSALFAGTSDTDFAIRAESSFFIRTNGSSGIERFRILSSGTSAFTGSVEPGTDNLYNLGSSTKRWATVFATSVSGSLTGSNVLAGQVVVAGTGGVLSGSNNFWWDNTNGRVGIGTTAPSTVFTRMLTLHNAGSAGVSFSSTNHYAIGANGNVLQFYDVTNGATRAIIDVAGNFGIGNSTTASARFQVSGSSTASTPTAIIREGVVSPTGGALAFEVENSAGATLFAVSGSGNVGIGTSSPTIASGRTFHFHDTTQPIFRLTNGTTGVASNAGVNMSLSGNDLYLNNQSSGQVKVYTAGLERLTVLSGGNVGIGTNNPGFVLEVNGAFAATTKSFVIQHPTKPGWKLRHGSLEGPENGVYVRGESQSLEIELPDYWEPLVDAGSITVQLTPLGRWQSLYVEEVKNNRVKIGRGLLMRLFGIKPRFFYTVTAERKDVKFEVEYNPVG